MLEYVILIILIGISYGVNIVMVTRKKTNQEDRVEKIVRALVKELGPQIAEAIKEGLKEATINTGSPGNSDNYYQSGGYSLPTTSIEMDERLVPVSINTDGITSNLKERIKEDKTEDKTLGETKSKLSQLFKKKEK